MRIRDKILIESGYITKTKVKWYGYGNYAHPYLWKENKSNTEYQESWSDPRIPKQDEKPSKQQTPLEAPKKNRGRKM